jgi:hypothetical protein
MSTPGHHCDLTIVGDVVGFYHARGGRIVGVVVQVDTDHEAMIPVLWETKIAGLQRGTRLWIRGQLHSERLPGERYGMVYVQPRHFEVLKPRNGRGELQQRRRDPINRGGRYESERVSETRRHLAGEICHRD